MSAEWLAGAIVMFVWYSIALLISVPLGRWLRDLAREQSLGLRCAHGFRRFAAHGEHCPWCVR